jgi:glycosyltransferase involved in cell wall biosynthesis
VISIIVPVYNAERTLRECINSVLEQTFGSFELLLVDNNSTDDSLKICREFERLDGRVRCCSCKEQGAGF